MLFHNAFRGELARVAASQTIPLWFLKKSLIKRLLSLNREDVSKWADFSLGISIISETMWLFVVFSQNRLKPHLDIVSLMAVHSPWLWVLATWQTADVEGHIPLTFRSLAGFTPIPTLGFSCPGLISIHSLIFVQIAKMAGLLQLSSIHSERNMESLSLKRQLEMQTLNALIARLNLARTSRPDTINS